MIKLDVQTSTLLHRVGIVVQHHATATIHRQVDKMAAVKTGVDSTGSRPRPETITRLHSRTGRVQGHNRPVIAVDGSASLPTPVDARMIALLDAEMTVAASRSWNSTNLSSRRATRLLMSGMAEVLIMATAAVWAAGIAVADMIADRRFAAEAEVSGVLAAAAEVLAAATAEIAVAVEIAAEEVEIVVEAVAVRKAEEDGPAPGLARSGANAM